jgi:hypothetical protein
MNCAITDLALDLGEFALDNELEEEVRYEYEMVS